MNTYYVVAQRLLSVFRPRDEVRNRDGSWRKRELEGVTGHALYVRWIEAKLVGWQHGHLDERGPWWSWADSDLRRLDWIGLAYEH